MAEPRLHPFLHLEETDRTHWLAAFFDSPSPLPPYEVRYPVLRAGESPYTWLCDQFQEAQGQAGLRDRIRRSVVEILLTEANREPVHDRAQVLGQLLEVAGTCGFKEIGAKLRGWISADAYADQFYLLGRQRIPLRRTTWSILVAWNRTRALTRFLKRDFSRPELGSQELCFAELGRWAPQEAIRRIPAVLDWPEPSWRETLFEVLSSMGPHEVVSSDYHEAWSECFGQIFFYEPKLRLLLGSPAPFRDLLQEVGLFYDQSFGMFGSLSVSGLPTRLLEVKSDRIVEDWDSEIEGFSNQGLAGEVQLVVET